MRKLIITVTKTYKCGNKNNTHADAVSK